MALWSLDKYNLLIIDDFADMRAMMRSIAVSLGAKDIQTARNGDEAIALMESNRFNIVLCDYNLGEGKDGQQVLEEARYRELLPYTTIFVMVTAENSSMMVFGALEHSPDDYLSKPVTRATLLARLRALTEKKERLHPVLEAMDRRCWATALKRCEALLQSGAASRADLQQLKGILLLELGDYDQAIPYYRDLIAERPLPWMLLGLGKALAYSQRQEEAREVLETLAKDKPNLVATYDLLADTLIRLGQQQHAQEVLVQGIAVSPKNASRQSQLGRLAYRQGDYDVAETAFRAALRLSKGSCLRGPGDYTDLVRTLIQKKDQIAAMKTIKDMQREFKQHPAAQAQGAMLEWLAQCKIGVALPVDVALQPFQNQPELLDSEVALFLAEHCLEQGHRETAKPLLQHVLRNQPDNPELREHVLRLCAGGGIGQEGRQLADAAARELEEVDRQGMQLTQQGKPEEAIAHYEQAAQPLPENASLNLSVAHHLILFMQKNGKTPENMQKARLFLDRVRPIAGTTTRYRQLRAVLNQLASNV